MKSLRPFRPKWDAKRHDGTATAAVSAAVTAAVTMLLLSCLCVKHAASEQIVSSGAWTNASLSHARRNLACTSLPNNGLAVFAGGYSAASNIYLNTVDIFDVAHGHWSTAALSVARGFLVAASLPNNGLALFAGGFNNVYLATVDIFHATEKVWSTAVLSVARGYFAAASLPDYGVAIFAGGYDGSTVFNTVDIYNASNGRWSTAALSEARYSLTATSLPNQALVLFAGGETDSDDSNTVDILDAVSGRWTTAVLSVARGYLSAASLPNHGLAIFSGGQGSDFSDVVDIFNVATGHWSTAVLSAPRYNLAAATLPNKGLAIFAGGQTDKVFLESVDIFDVNTMLWSTAALSVARGYLVATSVPNFGLVIFAGGQLSGTDDSDVVDIFNATTSRPDHFTTQYSTTQSPSTTSTFTAVPPDSTTVAPSPPSTSFAPSPPPPSTNVAWAAASLSVAREDSAAASLPNQGMAIFAGGFDRVNTVFLDTVDMFDSTSGRWSTAALSSSRGYLSAASLPNHGLALFAGGCNISSNFDDVDVFDSTSGRWSTATLSAARLFIASASLQKEGIAMFAGGFDGSNNYFDTVDIFDVTSGRWSTAALSAARSYIGAASLSEDGIIMFAGGFDGSIGYHQVVDMFNSTSGRWSTAALSSSRGYLSAASLPNHGLALFAGGFDGFSYFRTVDIFNVTSGRWSTAALNAARIYIGSASLPNKGIAIFAGGFDGNNYYNTADIFDVTIGRWSTAALSAARIFVSTASLPNKGIAMFAGGYDGSRVVDIVDIYCDSSITQVCGAAVVPATSNLWLQNFRLTVAISCAVAADIILLCIFLRVNKLSIAHSKGWILVSLISGPIVWFIWFVWHRLRREIGDLKLSEPLLDHSLQTDPPSSDSSDVISVPVSVTSRDIKIISSQEIKINKHVKEKRGGGGTICQVSWNGKLYALKRPHFIGAMTERDEAKFLRELENQARLRHPSCVGVYAVCLEKDNVFIVMEWMHGGSLWERLLHTREVHLAAQNGGVAPASSGLALSARKRIEIAREICDGLLYMHSKGMVHGDIKSLNVLLGKSGNAKLCDFGLTTLDIATCTTLSTSSGGTIAWAAPEIVCQGQKRHTPQTDIYALGVLMWELMTCCQPFEGLSTPQIIGQLVSKQRPVVPSPVPSGFPAQYVDLMMRCWDQDPSMRPSAVEVHRCMIEIDPSVQPNEPVQLFPPGHQLPSLAGPLQCQLLSCLTCALPENCCAPVLSSIVTEAEKVVNSLSVQRLITAHGLLPLEARSIFVYTASQGFAVCPSHGAPFSSYNTALRGAQLRSVSAWCDYSFLLYNALMKLPSVACTVYRGLSIPLAEVSLYWKGGYLWFRSPTSTTTDKDATMRQFGQGVDGSAGTFMELHVKNAKEISAFSAVPSEQERLIPHNTCFRVLQAWSAADVKLLGAFGTLPPNVDLVVVEEVTQNSDALSSALHAKNFS